MRTQPPRLPDYYALLGVEPDTSPAEIERAYRALVKRYSPALHALNARVVWEAEVMIKALHEAYAVLSDSILRWRYDDLRLEALSYPSWFSPRLAEIDVVSASEDDSWQSGLHFSLFPGRSWLTLLQQRPPAQPSGG